MDFVRRQAGSVSHHGVQSWAAGNRERVGREVPRRREMVPGEIVEEERQRGSREPGVGRVIRIGQHLVRFVPVVQPVAVDEAMLQARGRDSAPPALERQRPAPAAGFRVRQRDGGPERVERCAGFVHRAR